MFLDRFFLTLLLIFLPTQLAKHFFNQASLVAGTRVDYLLPTIYLTDIFVLLIFVFWFIRKRKTLFNKTLKTRTTFIDKYLLIFLVAILVNVILSAQKELAFLKLGKILEMVFLAFYLYQEEIPFKLIINYLLVGAVYSSFLGIAQFVKQGSLGGLLWFLGERTFTVGTPGIAKAEIFGRLYLRPYATFPHPNVLGGYLALLLPFLPIINNRDKKISRYVFQLVFILILIALFLTFSRIAIIAGLLGFIASLVIAGKPKKTARTFIFKQLLFMFMLILLFSTFITGRFSNLFQATNESIVQRKELTLAAIAMINHNPLFGIGLGNFLTSLSSVCQYCLQNGFYQPVHNLFLLVGAETGIFGLIFLIYLLLLAFQGNQKRLKTDRLLLITWLQIIFLSLFDHYFYTLQQGQLLFILLISFMIKNKLDYEKAANNTQNNHSSSPFAFGDSC